MSKINNIAAILNKSIVLIKSVEIGVLPIWITKSNVSSVGPSSERKRYNNLRTPTYSSHFSANVVSYDFVIEVF